MFKKLFKKSKEQIIYAPLNGDILPLEEVPDPVFSQKMMGEGIAIMPNDGKLVSPINGKVVQIPDTKHAIGLVGDDGTEILIHVGLETVALKGKGFDVKVQAGDTVKLGDLLMDIDLAYIKEHASSTVTPIIITNNTDGSKQLSYTDETKSIAQETALITVTS
ncbi:MULTISPECIES: PTS glucose transporter subunit IIA [Virgibacillus]|uniref:Glucose-specific phosphotransferase enzyme IIA component n=1 Tax=Virgibacillus dokdonensis TaxID=302167 RepID=A0A2K9IYJ9_9BACI|nr:MULTISPECIES: PTS glucose transporter subunit IIA [Virgibacillus]AUJ24799.1 Glucose-specific phosphotransferase enzyme IIA component [Virgibacillus dokdonensis]NWO14837.1 PTS glucose transporter subunit IIA [Virgibacillus sp.]